MNNNKLSLMLKTNTILLMAIALASSLVSCQKASQDTAAGADTTTVAADSTAQYNMLTAEEKNAGWELLFDGSTLNGWKRYNQDSIGPLWTVDNGAIKCDGEGLTEGTANNGGSLVTIKQFGNFDLTFEWKVSPGGNSGVLYHVVEKPEYKYDFETGPEYQVMDDGGWKGDPLKPAQKAGSNYDMYAAPDTKKLNPVGEWNTSRIVYNNGHVEHWLNGEKVVEFEEGDPEFQDLYKKSKWVEYPGWNKFKKGSIALQDHGAPVYFRNLKIKAL
jgi:hypothetical protein